MRFRTQAFIAQVITLMGQIVIASFLSSTLGHYWFWIFPVLLLCLLPRSYRQSQVVIDDVGVKMGNRTIIAWEEVDSLAKRRWTRAVFALTNGRTKSLSTFDWPDESKNEFYALLEKKGI